jgi:hypothetical protein
VERALALGAARTWVIDVSGGSMGRRDARMNALDVLLLSFAISRSHLDRDHTAARPEQRVVRLPRLDVGPIELRDFSQTERLIEAGYAAGLAAVRAEAAQDVPKPRRAERSEVVAPPREKWRSGRSLRTMTPRPRPLPDHVRVAVVGSGFAGIGSAVSLAREGIDDFVLLERASSVGGTWRDNTYPGCACDVPSHLYSFSFAPNPDWSHVYSRQPEIRAYLERVADEFAVRPHLHTDTDLVSGAGTTPRCSGACRPAAGPLTPTCSSAAAAGWSSPLCRTSPASRPSPARRSTRRAGTTTST